MRIYTYTLLWWNVYSITRAFPRIVLLMKVARSWPPSACKSARRGGVRADLSAFLFTHLRIRKKKVVEKLRDYYIYIYIQRYPQLALSLSHLSYPLVISKCKQAEVKMALCFFISYIRAWLLLLRAVSGRKLLRFHALAKGAGFRFSAGAGL